MRTSFIVILACVAIFFTQSINSQETSVTELQQQIEQQLNELLGQLGEHAQTITDWLNELFGGLGKREGVWDFVIDAFQLSGVWAEIQNLGGALVQQFDGLVAELLFAGQQKWEEAKKIFDQLIADLTAHGGDAFQYVQIAVTQLNALLNGDKPTKRDWLDSLLSTFNLEGVWAEIQSLGNGLIGQLTAELAELLIFGQEKWEAALVIFNQLVADLSNHGGDALTIVQGAIAQINELLNKPTEIPSKRDWLDSILSSFNLDGVWAEIQNLGNGLLGQLTVQLAELLFAGSQKWEQAVAIFNQLVADLTNHGGDALTIVTGAIGQVNELLNKPEKPDVSAVL